MRKKQLITFLSILYVRSNKNQKISTTIFILSETKQVVSRHVSFEIDTQSMFFFLINGSSSMFNKYFLYQDLVTQSSSSLFQNKIDAINQYFNSNAWTPVGIVLSTGLVTATCLMTYRFLFDNDEGLENKQYTISSNYLFRLFSDLTTRVKQTVFRLARYVPSIQRQIKQAQEDTLRSVYEEMSESVHGHRFSRTLPDTGLSKVKRIK